MPGGGPGKQYGGAVVNGKVVPHSPAELRREVVPDGQIVEHRVRKSAYVHERLHSMSGPQKLADEPYDAAEKVRQDFERARLLGSYATIDVFRTSGGGGQNVSDKVAIVRSSTRKVLKKLGNGTDETSFSQSCVRHAVGLGMIIDEWTQVVRKSGKGMNADKGASIFHGSLERLAPHYGMVDANKLAAIGNDKAYVRGVRSTIEFISVFSAAVQGEEKDVIGRLVAAMENRFGRSR